LPDEGFTLIEEIAELVVNNPATKIKAGLDALFSAVLSRDIDLLVVLV
jgi:hypothetical protein